MRILFILTILLNVNFCYGQKDFSSNYSKIINQEIKSGDEFLLYVSYCFTTYPNQTKCPFCDCYNIDTLRDILNARKNYKVEISVHNGYRGKRKSNLRLTNGTSKGIYDYLVGAKIDPFRITSNGYGEKNLYVFKTDTIIGGINIPSGTIVNEKFVKTIQGRELQEKLIALNRRIIVKFIF